MGKLSKIDWEEKYSVDIEEVDNHQKKIFKLFNELVEIKDTKSDPKEFTNKISEINDYAKLFLSTEEKYLRKKGYPDRHKTWQGHKVQRKRCSPDGPDGCGCEGHHLGL